MRQIKTQIDQGQGALLLSTLPSEWHISTAEGNYTISAEALRGLLKAHLDDSDGKARAWLDLVARYLEESLAAPSVIENADMELIRILKRPEFRDIGPPSQWDLLRKRIRSWLASLLTRIFGFVQQHSTESKIFFWLLMAAAIGLIGLWLFRWWTHGDQISLSIPEPLPIRTSDEWIRAVRTASALGDWREAIQCAYWAAIVHLEEMGALSRNKTRTPRENLRLLSGPKSGSPSQLVTPLAVLTNSLERFWYANLPASADDFAPCLKALEAFGCRLD